MTFARATPQSAPPYYPQGTLLQINSSGIEIGETMRWWLKVAVATGETVTLGSSHRTFIQALDPDTGKLVTHKWVTESLQPLPPGDELEAVSQLIATIERANEGDSSPLAAFEGEDSAQTDSLLASSPIVEVLEGLSYDEERLRLHLERKVERAFYEAGSALRELRDRRLYRSTHKTFKAYCQDVFGFTSDSAYLKIGAANVYDNLLNFLPTIGRQIPLPNNERQLRYIVKAKLKPSEETEVWQEAVEKNGGKVPPARIVKSIVDRIKAKKPSLAKDFCLPGDAFTLTRLLEGDRKYNGCWAIAVETREFTVVVDVHDQSLIVKPENLEPIDFPQTQRQLPTTLKRIRRLRSQGLLDRGAYTLLESFGKQIYLTELEEGLLSYLENHYGVTHEESR